MLFSITQFIYYSIVNSAASMIVKYGSDVEFTKDNIYLAVTVPTVECLIWGFLDKTDSYDRTKMLEKRVVHVGLSSRYFLVLLHFSGAPLDV